MDLGACPKSHTERLKTEYLAAKVANPSDPTFARFQKEYEANIFQFVDECDRRIRAAHRRLEKTPEENAKTTNLVSAHTWYRSPDRRGIWPKFTAYFLPFTFWKLGSKRMLTWASHNPLDARDRGNRIGNSGGNRKDRGLWSAPFPFALSLVFQQGETPSCLLDDY